MHMEIAKALILASGRGTEQPWPTAPAPRPLFPVANRPIIFHQLEALRAAGVLEVAILAEEHEQAAIEEAVGDGRRWGVAVVYPEAPRTPCLAAALNAGEGFMRGEPVLIQPGGVLLRDHIHAHISTFAREQLDALALRLPGPRAVAEVEPSPGYLLSPRAVSILREPSDGRTDPLAGIRACGGRVRVEQVDGCLSCHGDLQILLESNRRVLETLAPAPSPAHVRGCSIQGPVSIDPTAHVSGTLVRGPAIIGPGAHITDAYVGPYSSIGAYVTIEATEIEHSIVLPHAELRFVGTRLESSVIGAGARVVRDFGLPAAIRMSIGNGGEVVLR